MLGAHVRRHADEFVDETNLGFPNLGNWVAEIVIGGYPEDFDPLAVCNPLQLLAACLGPIQWVPVGPLAVDFNAVVAKSAGRAYEFRQGEGFAPIPATEVGDAIQSNFHAFVRMDLRGVSVQFSRGPKNRVVYQCAVRRMLAGRVIVPELYKHHS